MTRFVYIDEAGISNPAHEPFVIVAGVIVDADRQLGELERRIAHIADKHIPEKHRPGFVFHGMHLFNGGGPVFDRQSGEWPRSRRMDIARELAAIPGKMGLPLAFGVVQRSLWPLHGWVKNPAEMSKSERVIGQHVTAYMSCIMQVEMWMRKLAKHEVTMMIVEDNHQSRSLIKEQQNAHRNPALGGVLPPELRKYFPLKKIKSSPLFEEKSGSPALQMADFCAYVMKRRAMNDAAYADLHSMLHPCFAVHDLDEVPARTHR